MNRIWLHDSTGHAFQLQLSRKFAEQGFQVTHSYLEDFVAPKSCFRMRDTDIKLTIKPIQLGRTFPKYNFLRRLVFEYQAAKSLCQLMHRDPPDVMLAVNMSVVMAWFVSSYCRRCKIAFIYSVQDIYALAIKAALVKKFGECTKFFAWPARVFEQTVWRKANALVAITPTFVEVLLNAGVLDEHIKVIPNWYSPTEMPILHGDNEWVKSHGLTCDKYFLYAGTLGLKHSPEFLIALAKLCKPLDSAVVVVSEGLGQDYLTQMKYRFELDNLILLPYQEEDYVPQMYAGAIALVVLLDEEASQYSVPSKTLSYLCAGRPILMNAPQSNQAAQIIVTADAGLVSSGNQSDEFCDNASKLLVDSKLRKKYGTQARRYAENEFDLDIIYHQFLSLIKIACSGARADA